MKKGDKVEALRDGWDITKGKVYTVIEDRDDEEIRIEDDVKESHDVSEEDFKPLNSLPDSWIIYDLKNDEQRRRVQEVLINKLGKGGKVVRE